MDMKLDRKLVSQDLKLVKYAHAYEYWFKKKSVAVNAQERYDLFQQEVTVIETWRHKSMHHSFRFTFW